MSILKSYCLMERGQMSCLFRIALFSGILKVFCELFLLKLISRKRYGTLHNWAFALLHFCDFNCIYVINITSSLWVYSRRGSISVQQRTSFCRNWKKNTQWQKWFISLYTRTTYIYACYVAWSPPSFIIYHIKSKKNVPKIYLNNMLYTFHLAISAWQISM